MWTRELVLLPFCTNILDSRKQHLLYPDLQYSSEEGSDRLDYERRTGRDLDVVAQLEVLGKCKCRANRLESVALEDLMTAERAGNQSKASVRQLSSIFSEYKINNNRKEGHTMFASGRPFNSKPGIVCARRLMPTL